MFDHIDIPYYLKTSLKGVTHFVHFASPLITPDSSNDKVFQVAKEQISKVYSIYTLLILSLIFPRFNSLTSKYYNQLQSYQSLKTVTKLTT